MWNFVYLEEGMRIGIGYDVHAFAENRDLILGGVKIDHNQGLAGHSDADVLTHAIMDALLGALALGDIGTHFPDTDPTYQGANSLGLLKACYELITQKEYLIENIDCVVIAQVPKLAPYIKIMQENIAETLHLNLDQVSIKATTTEHLGFTGRKEGIATQAVVLMERVKHV